jgi:5-formyltetrahydrofolate cyclo-ligase
MQKTILRKEYLEKRKALTPNEITEKSALISTAFFTHFDLTMVDNLHIFLPIIKQNEINTFLIIDTLQKQFPTVSIVVSKSIIETCQLEHYRYDADNLLENKWGILEPIPTKLIPETDISLVLIPLLIFDKEGNRVGYGKGFYDRFLKKCKSEVLKIGLCLEEPIAKIEDINRFDIKLDFCITPKTVFNFK